MPGIEETLRTLRDVQGVYGSFVVSSNGVLVARDLPTIFDGDLFAALGPRVTRLYETIGSGGDELESCMLRYGEHKVYLRRIAWGVIGVLSTVAVNMPALRMVSNLVIRKIDPEVHAASSPSVLPPAAPPPRTISRPPDRFVPPPPVPPLPPPAPAEPSSRTPVNPQSARPVRMYRGRPVTD